jgi:hypothetical protein
MYTGNAVKAWRHLAPSEEQYVAFFNALRAKADEYRGRMRVYFHEAGLLEELRYRLREPAGAADRAAQWTGEADQRAALCVWRPAHPVARRRLGQFQRAWRDPQVARFVDDLAEDSRKTAKLHHWIHL